MSFVTRPFAVFEEIELITLFGIHFSSEYVRFRFCVRDVNIMAESFCYEFQRKSK